MSLDAVTLVVGCVAWVAIAVSLVATWALKPRPSTVGIRWVSAGLLVICSGTIIGQVGQILRWPYGAQTVVDVLTLILGFVVGGGCLIVGTVKLFSRTADRAVVEP